MPLLCRFLLSWNKMVVAHFKHSKKHIILDRYKYARFSDEFPDETVKYRSNKI